MGGSMPTITAAAKASEVMAVRCRPSSSALRKRLAIIAPRTTGGLHAGEQGVEPDDSQRQPDVDIALLAEEPDADAEQHPGYDAEVDTRYRQYVGGAGGEQNRL